MSACDYIDLPATWSPPIFFLIIGTMWDHVALARGHWFFGERYLLGPRLGLMPIEEYLFIFIVPYAILVIFRFFEKVTN